MNKDDRIQLMIAALNYQRSGSPSLREYLFMLCKKHDVYPARVIHSIQSAMEVFEDA